MSAPCVKEVLPDGAATVMVWELHSAEGLWEQRRNTAYLAEAPHHVRNAYDRAGGLG